MASEWPQDDGLLEFVAKTTPAQRLEWLEAALDFAHTVGALEKTLRLENDQAANEIRCSGQLGRGGNVPTSR